MLSTYVEALPQLVNRTTGRIHTSFNQAVTATGRLSSTNPNLQNIPVREEMGRRIRRAFIPSDSDHLLLSADYSQVELRLMAHLSGDESLIAAFAHGEDIHAATAAKLFNKTLDEVTSEERRRAKTANFGIIYGISAFGLSQRLEIPRKEAKDIIDGYFESYPKVKEYMDNVVAKAKEEGFVSTIFGRRRYLNDISSHNAVARGLAERNAVNAPIQGSAADIMKIAMINVHRRFAAEGIRSKVILQVHDELVVDMLRSEQERVAAIVTECMESAAASRCAWWSTTAWATTGSRRIDRVLSPFARYSNGRHRICRLPVNALYPLYPMPSPPPSSVLPRRFCGRLSCSGVPRGGGRKNTMFADFCFDTEIN